MIGLAVLNEKLGMGKYSQATIIYFGTNLLLIRCNITPDAQKTIAHIIYFFIEPLLQFF